MFAILRRVFGWQLVDRNCLEVHHAQICSHHAGSGKEPCFRDEHYKKPFAILDNRAVWLHSAEKFLNRDDVIQLLLVISADDREAFSAKFAANVAIMGIDIVEGGAERADSVENALARVKPEADFVAVHDAARPCIVDEWISTIFQAAQETGAAIPAIQVNGTIKRECTKNN